MHKHAYHSVTFAGRNILLLVVGALLLAPLYAPADTRTVLILHTNDLHDHVRPGYRGQGGLPYVASYVRSVRAERDDVLLLDAGDVQEKGDWVSFLTHGQLMYEAMGRIGYDAAVPGNHDIKLGFDHLDQCQAWLGRPFVCANILLPDGSPRYTPSHLFEVYGVRLGVIGLTRADKGESIPKLSYSKRVLVEEAAKLRSHCDVLVALVHEGGADAVELAEATPDIDVFITGHTHQTTQEPRVIEKTGALMVQAGSSAMYIGRLEITVDTDNDTIVAHEGSLVPMDHATIAPDPEIMAMVTEAEAHHCPEASRVVAHARQAMGMHEVAQLIAEALREAHGADISLAMADKVARNMLPEGDIDKNAVFRSMAPWAFDTMTVDMTGAELLAYLAQYAGTRDGPHWSGAAIDFERDDDRIYRAVKSDVEPERTYRVALTVSEWEDALSEFFEGKRDVSPQASDIKTGVILQEYIAKLGEENELLDAHIAACLRAAKKVGARHN